MPMNEKQDERRKEILASALQAFYENGYDKTSMDDVVRVTGLSKGTIYWYFKNKQELFAALMEYAIIEFFAEFEVVFTQAKDMKPRAAISTLFATATAMLNDNPTMASLTMDFMLQALHFPDLRHQYAEYYARYIEEVGAIIQRGIDSGDFRQVDARTAAATLIGLLDGVMLQALIGDELKLEWQWQMSSILQAAEQLFLHGLLKEGSSNA